MSTTDAVRPATEERSPYLEGNYAPIQFEITAEHLPLAWGELPADLAGMFVRTGSNPRFEPSGRYHWFDGDGMLHAITLQDGEASYRNRYVQTAGLQADIAAGRSLREGIMERPDMTAEGGPWKDTANTDLVFHNGRLLALWWLSGSAHQIRLPDLETIGTWDFNGTLQCNMGAHAKVDPRTGEMAFIDYGPVPPYLRYGLISADGCVEHLTAIELPGFRLQHDIALTERYAVLFDMSMTWDPALLKTGRMKLEFFREQPSRIGLLPKRGKGSELRWFEVAPFFMYHAVCAWEDGDEVVLVGCRIDDPTGSTYAGRSGRETPLLGHLRLEPALHEWRLNLRTGTVRETQLDDRLAEFPRINDALIGGRARFNYHGRFADAPTLLFDGIIKYDLDTMAVDEFDYPAGWYGGEPSFAAAEGATEEDDGYLLTFVTEEATGRSELYVIDARTLQAAARIAIPQRVPTGYHTRWVSAAELAASGG
jgi:carotenoid cleavage dioxygenase-like enzyme